MESNKDQEDDNNAGNGIESLRGRFHNLKNENQKLSKRKEEINLRMEKVKEDEKKELAKINLELYEKTRIMANLQKNIEDITEKN